VTAGLGLAGQDDPGRFARGVTHDAIGHPFVIGVDAHARNHAVAILACPTGEVVDEAQFPATVAGLQRAVSWVARRTSGDLDVLWVIEGVGTYGARLARGPINHTLEAVGLGALTRDWLGDFNLALPALGLVGTWTTLGLCMVLFVSGSAAISTSLYDAARVDGAGVVREFFAVTLPGLRPQIAVALTLTVTGALRTFDLVWLTTRGGPGTSTITPSFLLYTKAFSVGDVGAAAAIGVVLAVSCLIISLVILRFLERDR
jgi:hypothetical protein